jgi:transcriptional regulator with XRE-family HTH domain
VSSGGFVDNPVINSFSSRRIAAGLTLEDVSREFGVSAGAVRDWEDGRARVPEHIGRTLDLIARVGTGRTASPQIRKVGSGLKPRQPEFAVTRDEGPLYRAKNLIKSKKRVADHGEVFTPPWLVEKMLDLVKGETERIDSRFLEPACGSGNFLVPILQRKLAAVEAKYGKSDFEKRHYALLALTCVYGIELLADNIAECRANMLEVFASFLTLDEKDELYRAASHVLSLNLINGDAMTMKGADGGPITIVEWGYIGKGKFQRRDFSLKSLTQAGELKEERQGYAGQPSLFATLGQHPVFQAVASHSPMNVRELAAQDGAA